MTKEQKLQSKVKEVISIVATAGKQVKSEDFLKDAEAFAKDSLEIMSLSAALFDVLFSKNEETIAETGKEG